MKKFFKKREVKLTIGLIALIWQLFNTIMAVICIIVAIGLINTKQIDYAVLFLCFAILLKHPTRA